MMKLYDRWANRFRNRARILQVADDVEANKDFWMIGFTHGCGTPGCIAGHAKARAVAEWKESYGEPLVEMTVLAIPPDAISIPEAAGRYLGIGQYHRLFFPKVGRVARFGALPGMKGFITKEHAASCLRHLAETGEIDWRGTVPG